MTFETLKERTVEEIRKDPVGFLYEQFKRDGAFENSIVAGSDIDELPIIMRVIDSEQFLLTVTGWDYIADCFSKTMCVAHGTQSEDGSLQWEFDFSDYNVYDDAQEADRFLPEIIIGKALEEFGETAARIAAREGSRESAWLFPRGLKPALKYSVMMFVD